MITKTKIAVIVLIVGFLASIITIGIPVFAETIKKGEPIVIGVPLPRGSPHGQNGEEPIILAMEEINAAGGIKLGGMMRPIKLEIIDDRDQEPGVPTSDVLLAIEKLILDRKPHIILGGPIMSEPAVVSLDLFAKYKIVNISCTGAWTPAWNAKLAKEIERYKYSFKITGHIGDYMKDVIGLLRSIKQEFGFNKIYTTIADAAHCRAAADIIEKMAPQDGWEVVGKEVHPLATTDFSMLMRNVRQSGAQVMFVWDHLPEAVMMIKQRYDLKVPALPLGFADLLGDPFMWEKTDGKAAHMVVFGGEAGSLPGQEVTPLTKHFFEAYKKRWGRELRDILCAPSYSGLYMIKEVIERTQSLDRDKLVSAIENVDIITVGGRLRFDKTNHQAIYGDDPKESLLAQIFQWQDGKRVTIWPKKIAIGKIQLPPWMKK
jgi:branched-chain amino acid transport system substrate-binding protein